MALSADAIILIGNITVYYTLLSKIQYTMFNSGSESFHSHYNSQFYTLHPNIFQVIDVLKDFQVQIMLKISSISNNKINVQINDTLKKHNILHVR
jgi:hypothetical protein